ncbi:MAG: dihydroneopterin aldolase [Rhodobacteraceae bacterium]|nr:dihydroneopterin aldolase [Paracoccaceae bacterium]
MPSKDPTHVGSAFADLHGRACALAVPDVPDRLLLREHIVQVDIGGFQQERGHRQRLRFDIVLEVAKASLPPGGAGDDMDQVLSYDQMVWAIEDALAQERLELLETLAERIALRVLQPPQALRAFVRIQKLDRGNGALGVEILRRRSDAPQEQAPKPLLRPILFYLPQGAQQTPHLSAWLDQMAQRRAPLILCPEAHDLPRPRVGDTGAQHHIDLLALDQSGLALAGRDRRLTAVASQTELAWHIRHLRPCVWLPARMSLNAADPCKHTQGAPLTLWLADLLSARMIVAVDASLAATQVPVRHHAATAMTLPPDVA